MAVVVGNPTYPQRAETIGADWHRQEQRSISLRIEIDPDTETVDDALAICPARGSSYIGHPELWLSRRVPRQVTRSRVEVDLEFTHRPPGTQPNQIATPNPVSWAPKWMGSSIEKMQRVMYRDNGGFLVVPGTPDTVTTTAPGPVSLTSGEIYSTPIYEYVNILVARWKRYYPIVQPALDEYLLEWNNTISSEVFRGKPKYTWLLSVSASPAQVNDFEVAELTFEFRYNKLGWFEERLQAGSYYIDAADGNKRKPFVDGLQNPIVGLLTATGGKSTTPIYRRHRGSYEEKNFNILLT